MTKEWEAQVRMYLTVLKKRLYTPVETMHFSFLKSMEHLDHKQVVSMDGWQEISEGTPWGREYEYGWFRTQLKLGSWANGCRVAMNLNLGGEATLFVNGEVFGCRRADRMSAEHHYLVDNWIVKTSEEDEVVEFMAETYAGHDRPPEVGEATAGPVEAGWHWEHNKEDGRTTLGHCTYGIWNEEAYHLLLEASALLEIWEALDESSVRKTDLDNALMDFATYLDFTLTGDAFRENVEKCRSILRPYLECVNGSTAPRIWAIGHSHLDLAWFWPIEETQRKCARTLAAQLRHMDEYPEYRMIQSQPQIYEILREHYPDLYEKIKEKVASGQLIPEGAMWVEPDSNVPTGESLIRQIHYGKKFFREEFGVDNKILWLPDVFGFTAALPQIMKGCDVDYFTTAKVFWAYNGGDPFPYHYFNWKGIDGSVVESYIHMLNCPNLTDAHTLLDRWNGKRPQEGLRSLMMPVGYGDGGGGACRDHIENVRLLQNCEGAPKISFEDPRDFFEAMPTEYRNVPEYVGELYFQAHRGVLTSQAKMKKYNRRSELTLREAEMWSALADLQGKGSYPAKELDDTWKPLLKNQMHDILPGSAIHKVYERGQAELLEVMSGAKVLADRAIDQLAGEGEGLVVFNSLSWERTGLVQLPEGWSGARSEDGAKLSVQTVNGVTYAAVTVPPCGMLTIYNDTPAAQEAQPLRACENVLENELIRVSFNHLGEITSVYDKETGMEWATGTMNAMHLYRDTPSHYEAWDLESIRVEVPLENAAEITLEADGPLFSELKVTRNIGSSPMEQWIRLEAGSRQVTFRTRIDWKECQKMLKVAFPVNVSTETIHSEIQYGYIQRPNHRTRLYDADRFEVANHRWSALVEPQRGFGVLNDCKYGISCLNDTMELTLLRSPIFPDETADRGIQEFTYALYCWNTPLVQSGVARKGYELNVALQTAPGQVERFSAFSVSDDNIVIDFVKKAENGEGIVVRAYESMGSRRKAVISTNLPLNTCYTANMLERLDGELAVNDGKVALEFGPFEVKTLVFSAK